MVLVPSTLAHPDIDPDYCREHPDEEKCRTQEGPKKEICEWSVNGAPANGVTFNAAPGSQVVTLDCPNHIMLDWDCGYKRVEQPFGDLDQGMPDAGCEYLGTRPTGLDGEPCATTSTWIVNAPNVRTYTMYLKASAFKDEDCDGKPDDWNSNSADGGCLLNNEYSPKHDQAWQPYKPAPDGHVDECDIQTSQHEWRQFN